MVDYREILRLNSLKYTQRQIAASVHSSRNTISEVIKLAAENNLCWPLDDQLTNEKVYALLYPNKLEVVNPRKEPDYSYIHKELAKPGVNLTLLWTEYCSDCYASKLTPYMYTQFCDKYRKWARLTKATMRITHKPGDAMQVDWAGTTIPYYDRVTGEATDSYLFAAVLPCSCYAYVEACDDMKTTKIQFNGRSYYSRIVESVDGEELLIGSTILLDALQPGSFNDENEGFASKEAERIYDEIFFFTDERTLQLPENELIAELKKDNPDWFE